MSHPLITSREIIRASWSLYIHEWNQALRITSWLMVLPILLFVLMLALRPTGDQTWVAVLFGLVVLLTFVVEIWVMVRLLRWTLITDRGGKIEKNEMQLALSNIPAVVLIGIIQGLAVLGGTILFIFPGIWLGIALMFAQLCALEDGAWGTKALSASYALVKGRWFSVFWRVLVVGLFSVIVVVLVSNIFFLLMSLIAGGSKVLMILKTQTLALPLAYSANNLLQSIWLAVVLPFFVIWEVKLFHGLKQ